MDLKNVLKDKVIKEVLSFYNESWYILVYDDVSGKMIADLFTKSQLTDYFVSQAFHINLDKPIWDLPVVYFVADTESSYSVIVEEYKKKIFSKYSAVVIGTDEFSYFKSPELTFIIKYFNCNLQIQEERVFISDEISHIHSYIESLLYKGLNLFCMPSITQVTAIDSKIKIYGDMLILDRRFDLFTPLIHFFTFRSLLCELGEADQFHNDVLWPNIRYVHMAKVNEVLQYHMDKLSANLSRLDDQKVTTEELSKMVFDAPDNIKLKESIAKFSELLKKCFSKLKYLQNILSDFPTYKNLIETELVLATSLSRGEKVTKLELMPIFSILESPNISKSDKERILYMVKLRNFKFSNVEEQLLGQVGFSNEDILATVDNRFVYPRNASKYKPESKFEISRFEPYLRDIIVQFTNKEHHFFQKRNNLTLDSASEERVYSLRKTKLITATEKNISKKILVIYIKGGITVEEIRLVYELSVLLGIEIIIGSSKILKPGDIIKDIKKDYLAKNTSDININKN